MDVPIEEKLVDGLAEEYAAYFKLDTTPQVKLIEECIEENLTHLEEFCTMLDLIRNESNGYSTDLVPQFKAKKQQLRTVYAKIDKLLELVDTVKVTVDSMEAELTKAEAKFNSSNKFSRFFSSLLGTSPDRSNRQVDSEFHSLNIFSTKGFFDSEPVVTPDLEENN